jgi:hypothetical protein
VATTGKAQLPPIDDDLVPTHKRVDLKAIRSKAGVDDATIEDNSRRLGDRWGASTSLETAAVAELASAASRTPIASLRIEIPVYLDRELAMRAADKRVTKQFLVLKALEQAGYHIDPADLIEDKRKARRRKT